MKSLTSQLQAAGLSLPQISACFFQIEDWLEEHYPVLAKLYHREFILNGLLALEAVPSNVEEKREGTLEEALPCTPVITLHGGVEQGWNAPYTYSLAFGGSTAKKTGS